MPDGDDSCDENDVESVEDNTSVLDDVTQRWVIVWDSATQLPPVTRWDPGLPRLSTIPLPELAPTRECSTTQYLLPPAPDILDE